MPTIIIDRFDGKESFEQSYTLAPADAAGKTVLATLLFIKQTQDPTLNFTASCRCAICGACAVRVNGHAVVACDTMMDKVGRPRGLIAYDTDAAVAAQLNVRRLVPVHWGAYPMALHSWNEPILRLMPAAAALNVATITPKLGQVFDADSQSEAWYRYTNPKK